MTREEIRTQGLEITDAETKVSRMHFCGHIFEALPSGALFWPAENTLLVADLHFEKMASFARRGQLLPPYDTGLTLAQLQADLEATSASRLIALGDSFHRDEGVHSLQSDDRARLDALVRETDWIWISGNHDPSPHALGGTCVHEFSLQDILFIHEPRKTGPQHMAGHLHPAARVRLNGRSTRRPCFVADERLFILPAYGASTGNLNILSSVFQDLLAREAMQVVMLGREKSFPVSVKRLVSG